MCIKMTFVYQAPQLEEREEEVPPSKVTLTKNVYKVGVYGRQTSISGIRSRPRHQPRMLRTLFHRQ